MVPASIQGSRGVGGVGLEAGHPFSPGHLLPTAPSAMLVKRQESSAGSTASPSSNSPAPTALQLSGMATPVSDNGMASPPKAPRSMMRATPLAEEGENGLHPHGIKPEAAMAGPSRASPFASSTSRKATPSLEGAGLATPRSMASSSLRTPDPDDMMHLLPKASPFSETETTAEPAGSSHEGRGAGAGDATPTRKSKSSKSSTGSSSRPVQLIDHLPVAREDAMKTFEELRTNWYQNGKIGRSRGQEEGMACECRYRFGIDPPSAACGEESGCINRLTQVECLEADCNCGSHCLNQRFQRAQYADVEIVQTEKKGFGLRAAKDLPADSFVYEYIGEVVEHNTFMKRMKQYSVEGIRHFYFMMLQREEYLDATRKGGIARFINHSCNPNCFVAKWHVGKHMRMGIFAQRDIAKGEELTFNYNVDRYGNQAQECFCGEPNCSGTLGGKTQTDIGGMDQLFIDALGIKDEVDRLEAKGTRKKKSKHLDDDFNPEMRPMEEDEVAKVVTAIRQAQSNRRILVKLLERIHKTEALQVQKALVRLHGFVLMAGVLEEWRDDVEMLKLAMGSLARWPLIARNKVVDAGVDRIVQDLTSHEDESVAELARDLLGAWDQLEMSYRIARKEIDLNAKRADPSSDADMGLIDEEREQVTLDTAQAPNAVSQNLSRLVPRPLGTLRAPAAHIPRMPRVPMPGRVGFESPSTPHTPERGVAHLHPGAPPPQPSVQQPQPTAYVPSIEEIIRRANESAAKEREAAEVKRREEEAAEKAAEKARQASAKKRHHPGAPGGASSSSSSRERSDKRRKGAESSSGSSEERLVKRLKKLVGEVVVKCMSRYSEQLDREVFKKHARELTDIVCAKEMKNGSSWPPPDGKLESLSSEKRSKIKTFADDYARKLVERKGKAVRDASKDVTESPPYEPHLQSPSAGPSASPEQAHSRPAFTTAPAPPPALPQSVLQLMSSFPGGATASPLASTSSASPSPSKPRPADPRLASRFSASPAASPTHGSRSPLPPPPPGPPPPRPPGAMANGSSRGE